MAALEQLDGGFAFADAGVADHQHALAIDVHQHAVAGDLGGQGPVQIVDDVAGQLHGGLFRPQQGAPVLAGNLHQLGKNLHIPGNDQGWDFAAQQILEYLSPLLQGHGLQKGELRLAQNLQAFWLEVVIKAHQLQGRAVHVGDGDHPGVIVQALVDHLKVKILHQLAEAGRVASYFFHIWVLHPVRCPAPAHTYNYMSLYRICAFFASPMGRVEFFSDFCQIMHTHTGKQCTRTAKCVPALQNAS